MKMKANHEKSMNGVSAEKWPISAGVMKIMWLNGVINGIAHHAKLKAKQNSGKAIWPRSERRHVSGENEKNESGETASVWRRLAGVAAQRSAETQWAAKKKWRKYNGSSAIIWQLKERHVAMKSAYQRNGWQWRKAKMAWPQWKSWRYHVAAAYSAAK
jgi:hypothetical protein